MLLLSLGFTVGSKAKCFCLAMQTTLGIDASALPLLKAVGTCSPGSAGGGMEMAHAVCLASAAEWRWQEQVSGPLLTKKLLFTSALPKEKCTDYIITTRSKAVCFHTTMRGELVFAPQ